MLNGLPKSSQSEENYHHHHFVSIAECRRLDITCFNNSLFSKFLWTAGADGYGNSGTGFSKNKAMIMPGYYTSGTVTCLWAGVGGNENTGPPTPCCTEHKKLSGGLRVALPNGNDNN